MYVYVRTMRYFYIIFGITLLVTCVLGLFCCGFVVVVVLLGFCNFFVTVAKVDHCANNVILIAYDI